MIERKFIAEKIREREVEEYIATEIGRDKYSFLQIKRTPLGEKITIYTSKPGFIVGRKGETIKKMTFILKDKFGMENPQVEVAEFERPEQDAKSMADYIAGSLERFGSNRFKSVGYRVLQRIMDAGAMGAEIVISGRGVPSSRAKHWRFYAGYLKKSGDIAETQVRKAVTSANLKSGTVGIKVSIMPADVLLPDRIIFTTAEEKKEPVEEVKEDRKAEEAVEELKKAPKKKAEKKGGKKPANKKPEHKKHEKKEEQKPEHKKSVKEEKKREHKKTEKKEEHKKAEKKEESKEEKKEELKEAKEEIKEESKPEEQKEQAPLEEEKKE